MSLSPRRLLGLAFASADALVEVLDGRIALALGATQELLGGGQDNLVGKDLRDLFQPDDQPLIDAMLACAQDGARRGPIVLATAGPRERHVQVIMRALPQNEERVSCAFTAAHPVTAVAPQGGLQPRDAFDELAKGLFEAGAIAGMQLDLAMVEFSDLDKTRAALSDNDAAVLDRKVAAALRAEAHAGAAATQLSANRFALLRRQGESAEAMVRRLTRLVSSEAAAQVIPIRSGGDPGRTLRALRYALEDFLKDGLEHTPPKDLSAAMNRSLQRTLARAGALGAVITERRFTLAYQPVVALADGLAHHHEVLIRFEGEASPFAQIRMAEEFDLIEELDHAVAEQAVRKLANDAERKLRLAINVSGRTIVNESFVDHVHRLLQRHDEAKGRLILEVTESAAIENLAYANRNIQTLRSFGCAVCLDDFGAGAASFAYLQRLQLDIVKIDGRYVRELADNSRDGAMVRRLVDMCRDLRIRTVAEMVETVEVEEVVRSAGVDFAQGWLYGKAADKPMPALRPSAPVRGVARRTGTSESWG